MATIDANRESAILGGGCFWCVEAVYMRVDGIKSAVSGYAGGNKPDPSYEEVCVGNTGHAEVVKVEFEPQIISYAEILEIFFMAHDPTSENRQGHDTGTQYRSIILFENEDQRQVARHVLSQAQAHHKDRIVTEITPLDVFYKAEVYHQDYYKNHPQAGYCRSVIAPKLKKLKAKGTIA